MGDSFVDNEMEISNLSTDQLYVPNDTYILLLNSNENSCEQLKTSHTDKEIISDDKKSYLILSSDKNESDSGILIESPKISHIISLEKFEIPNIDAPSIGYQTFSLESTTKYTDTDSVSSKKACCKEISSNASTIFAESPIKKNKFAGHSSHDESLDSESSTVQSNLLKVKKVEHSSEDLCNSISTVGTQTDVSLANLEHNTSSDDIIQSKKMKTDILNASEKTSPEQSSIEDVSDLRTKNHSSTAQICEWLKCGLSFDNVTKLMGHVTEQHIKPNKNMEFICHWKGCDRRKKGFPKRFKIITHIRTHTKEKPFQCSMCEKAFSNQERLKIHTRSHTGEKPYTCPMKGCDKSYSNTADRFKHVQTHQQNKPYCCPTPDCGKKYTDPSSLRKHIRSAGHDKQSLKNAESSHCEKYSYKSMELSEDISDNITDFEENNENTQLLSLPKEMDSEPLLIKEFYQCKFDTIQDSPVDLSLSLPLDLSFSPPLDLSMGPNDDNSNEFSRWDLMSN